MSNFAFLLILMAIIAILIYSRHFWREWGYIKYYSGLGSRPKLAQGISGGKSRRGKDIAKDMKAKPASRFEEDVRHIFEKITGQKFPCILPSWLKIGKRRLELDGYNAELGIAFEAQGPQHSKFDRRFDQKYGEYKQRISDDRQKIKLAAQNGVDLVIIDYRLPKAIMFPYIESRIYDICKDTSSPFFAERRRTLPEYLFFDFLPGYVPLQNYNIYER